MTNDLKHKHGISFATDSASQALVTLGLTRTDQSKSQWWEKYSIWPRFPECLSTRRLNQRNLADARGQKSWRVLMMRRRNNQNILNQRIPIISHSRWHLCISFSRDLQEQHDLATFAKKPCLFVGLRRFLDLKSTTTPDVHLQVHCSKFRIQIQHSA